MTSSSVSAPSARRSATKKYELDVIVTRGGHVESTHRVHAAVVDEKGTLIGTARDPQFETFWRSCAKPFQVMPFLASGGFDRAGWGADQLALACASHGGEPEHVAIAQGMLNSVGLEEGDLACGPHEPLSSRGARIARESRVRLTRLHNNCSGKHAAMLARAKTEGWQTQGYERDGHPVQQAVLESISYWSSVPADNITTAVDGCGAAVFSLPLEAMARAYARFATSVLKGDELATRVMEAIVTRPFLIGGTERFDTVLIEETEGRVIAKVGAEGVHSGAILDAGIGFVVKVEDGAQRAHCPAVLRLLQKLGALPDTLPPRLEEFMHKPIRNTRNEIVGDIQPA